MTSRGAVLAIGLLVAMMGHPGGARADHGIGVTFGAASATPSFGEGIAFEQAVELDQRPKRIELELSFPREAGASLIEVPIPDAQGPTTLSYDYSIATDGHLLPNTTISARWVITSSDGTDSVVASDPVRVVYRDTRFEWRTRKGDIVRVHWSEGGDDFGRRALEIGERAVRETTELLGVVEREPIDFFVYPDEESFRAALGPGARENVGGQANAEIRTLFALIGPGAIDDPWVGIVIPHELVHLVFDTAVDNPYHFPPRWLNEGLAVYLSEGYGASDRELVEAAAGSGELIPLSGLSGEFPTTRERFFLAYAESVSAVDYMVRAHGRDALLGLIRSYSAGRTDDEALEGAIGLDAAAFDGAWRSDLGAADPIEHGPRPAPAGPLPADWTAADPPSGASPTAGVTTPAAPAASGASADVPIGAGSGGFPLALLGLAVLGTAGAVIALLLVRRRRRPTP